MKRLGAVLALAAAVLLPAAALRAQEIERIDIVGNDRVTRDAIEYYLSSRAGDAYNPDSFRRDFRVLWSTGFFSDLKIEEEDGARGKVVRIVVQENPMVRTIAYKTGKKVKENDIVSKLKEKDQNILPYSWYSPAKLQRVKAVIGDLLAEKGLQAAKIDAEVARKGKNEVEVVLRVDEGAKVRVGDVLFVGRVKLPDALLRDAMKDNQKHGLVSWIGGKDVYKSGKLAEDVERIKKRLQEFGYMEAVVGEPQVESYEKTNILHRKQVMMRIVIPVNAGYLYRMGELTIEGNKTMRTEYIRKVLGLNPGDVYSTKSREKALEKIGEDYRNIGHLYAQVIPVENLDPKRKVVNVQLNVNEGEVAFLNRLEFKGNLYTKDKVIRREMVIREGDRFSLGLFKDSVLRVKQLGLVDLEGEPEILPDPQDPTKINVKVPVKELQRNNIQFTAGYSGYEGTFVAASYSTVNFLGAGENLDLTLQHGKRIKNYSFGFSEPYVLDMPVTAGFNIFHREMLYPWLYNQRSRGVDFSLGARLWGYWRGNVVYSYQKVKVWLPSDSGMINPDTGLPYYDPAYMAMFGYGNYNISSIQPMLYMSTIDSPLTPSSGTMYSASLKYAGTFLGGEIDLWKPRLEFTHYQPLVRGKHTVGFHLEYEFVEPIRGSQVPFWEKFYLGGERSVRGYEIYSIGPRNANGTIIGGDKSLVANAEYIFAVGGPLYLIAFYDVGNALPRDQRFSWKGMYSSAGLECRIFVPALRIPFRLIFAYNNKKIFATDTSFAFRFAVGTTF